MYSYMFKILYNSYIFLPSWCLLRLKSTPLERRNSRLSKGSTS